MHPIDDGGIWFLIFVGVGLVWWLFQKGQDLARKPARDAEIDRDIEALMKKQLERSKPNP